MNSQFQRATPAELEAAEEAEFALLQSNSALHRRLNGTHLGAMSRGHDIYSGDKPSHLQHAPAA